MEFFQFIDVQTFRFAFPQVSLWVMFLTAGVIFLILHLLQGVGLYAIASRANMSNKWMAFVPVLSNYYLGKITGTCTFFGAKIKNAGVWLAIAEGFVIIASGLQLFAQLVLDKWIVYINDGMGGYTYQYTGFPPQFAWIDMMDTVMVYLIPVLSLIYEVLLIVVLFSFFRKYSARYALAFTILSLFFPIKGIFIFVVRKNAPIDYEQFLREQREAIYRQQQQYGNPYQPPYGGGNPYGNPYGQPRNPQQSYNPPQSDDPFEGFYAEDEKKGKSKHPDNDDFFGA